MEKINTDCKQTKDAQTVTCRSSFQYPERWDSNTKKEPAVQKHIKPQKGKTPFERIIEESSRHLCLIIQLAKKFELVFGARRQIFWKTNKAD